MQLLDMYIVVLPASTAPACIVSIWDFVPLLGIGATLAFFYLRIVAQDFALPESRSAPARIASHR